MYHAHARTHTYTMCVHDRESFVEQEELQKELYLVVDGLRKNPKSYVYVGVYAYV